MKTISKNRIVNLLMNGYTQADISRECECSRQYIHQILRRKGIKYDKFKTSFPDRFAKRKLVKKLKKYDKLKPTKNSFDNEMIGE